MERVEGHSASVAGAGVVLATRMATVAQILEEQVRVGKLVLLLELVLGRVLV
jgi:hypothetical protein